MIRKIFLPVILVLLAWALFTSPIVKEVSAGVAILLFGMIMLEEGFNAFVEGPLQKLLQKMTDKLYKSLTLGFVVTSLLQSSSLISVITISFISAGLLGLSAGIGIIFGANLGTTATAWLVTVFGLNIKVSLLAMPMLAFGILFVFQKSKGFKGFGYVLAGLGFFFLGIHFMKNGFDVYSDSINLADFAMPGFLGLIVYTVVGILITLVLQSSSAAMALILTALAAGQIDYNNSLALAIGANVGTTITAIIGSLSSNVAGKRLAGAHLIFNLGTGIIALALIVPIGMLVEFISDGFNVAADNYTMKLSIFHTIFNLIGVMVMVPFINFLVKILTKLIVEKDKDKDDIAHPIFLNESVLAYPQTAIRALLNESKRLFEEVTFQVASHGLNIKRTDIRSQEKMKKVVKKSRQEMDIDIDDLYYNQVKTIYGTIIKYATISQSRFALSQESNIVISQIKLANRYMVEVIKDMKGLRSNVQEYMVSDNEHIRKEYDKLRRKVSKVLRAIYLTQSDEEPNRHLKVLEKKKAKASKSGVMVDGTLNNLMSNDLITNEMASSLAYDSEVVANIIKRLIDITELLYISSDTLIGFEEEIDDNQLVD